MKKTINLGLIGLGTVGTGVVKILRDNLSLIEKKVGTKIKVKKICDKRNIKSYRKMKIDSKLLTTDVCDV
ncbi:homoserine dehydrogenase, partial [bacterium]|nr:homoserine dehydrogenase [bacterium]